MTDNDDLEHNRADAPPSAIDASLARLGYTPGAVPVPLSWPPLDAVPALPLELAAADALEEAESLLLDVRDGTASYTDLAGSLERIVALLRGGLGDDHGAHLEE